MAGGHRVKPDRPSLIERLPRPSPRVVTMLWIGLLTLAAALLLVIVVAETRTRRLSDATRAAASGQGGAARLRAAALAEAFARPTLAATLAAVAAHLPPGTQLAGAERTSGGALRLTIDTPDPDALRAAIGDDAWLARFRERAEDQREDGGFRVTIEVAS